MSAALLTVSEAAAELKISKPTLYRLFAAGQLEWVQIGSHRRVTRAAVEAFVQACTQRVAG